MEIIVAMLAGCFVGATVFPARLRRLNSTLQTIATTLLIFSMGVMLGSRENFLAELGSVGLASLAFCLLPTALSLVLVYALTRAVFGESATARQQASAGSPASSSASAHRRTRARESNGEATLVACAVGALVLGACYGLSPIALAPVDWLAGSSDVVLYALMFFVGITVGQSKGIVEKIRRYHVKALVIPAGITAGSLAGGLLASLLCGMNPAVGCAIGGGMGWYSLTGVVLSDLAGAQAGSIAFLANLLRELVSFFSIPLIARRLNYLACIAPAGATSEDTTLPMLVRCTNEETVVLAVVNGVVCSALVPVIVGVLQPLF